VTTGFVLHGQIPSGTRPSPHLPAENKDFIAAFECKFGQTNVLTGKFAETKELLRTVDKEQNGTRPLWAGASFRDSAKEGGSQQKSAGEKNFSNQIPKK
jgi:hypothetical protein